MKTSVKKVLLTREEILKRISDYDIYKYYLSDFSVVGEPFRNTIRGETTPSMKIDYYQDRFTHFDFGDSRFRGDAFNLVEQMLNCDYYTALKKIDKDFNLGISERRNDKLPAVIQWEKPKIEETIVKFPPKLNIITRGYDKWTPEEYAYWGKMEQGESELKRENVFVPKNIFRNGRRIPLPKGLLIYCYFYEEIGKWAIYRPQAPKRAKDTPFYLWKWDKNVPFNYVEGLEEIKNSKGNTFVVKSKKDKMVLQTALETDRFITVQAEDPSTLSEENLQIIKDNSDIRYIVSDNDKKGKEFSWWLTKEHGYKHVNPPDNYLHEVPIKTDFADIAFYYNIQRVKDYFKYKNII